MTHTTLILSFALLKHLILQLKSQWIFGTKNCWMFKAKSLAFLILFYIYNQHNVFHLHLNSFNMLALSLRFIVIISFIYNQYNFTCTHIYFLRSITWTFVGFISFWKIDFTVFRKLLFVSGIFTYMFWHYWSLLKLAKIFLFKINHRQQDKAQLYLETFERNPLWSGLVCFKPFLYHLR